MLKGLALSPLYTNAKFDAFFPIRVNPLKTGIVRDTVESSTGAVV